MKSKLHKKRTYPMLAGMNRATKAAKEQQEYITTRMLFAERAIGFIASTLHNHAYKNKHEPLMVQVINEALADVKSIVERITDDTLCNKLCNNNCKSMYFCERKKGHKGKHTEMGLAWD